MWQMIARPFAAPIRGACYPVVAFPVICNALVACSRPLAACYTQAAAGIAQDVQLPAVCGLAPGRQKLVAVSACLAWRLLAVNVT